MLQPFLDEVVHARTDIAWSISIRDASGRELACSNADRTMKTASVGKLLLLVEIARQCEAGDLGEEMLLSRTPEFLVGDSGLWQHLHVDKLSVNDLCVLIASVSDNLATNVLLDFVGLQALDRLAEFLNLTHTALLDYVRDCRGPDDPPTFSTGSASELSQLMSRLARKELVSPPVSEQVNAWLAKRVDLSMVGSAFGLDPLAHALPDRNTDIRNKTGADPGIRADVGSVGGSARLFSYAVIANWDTSADLSDAALSGMNAIGSALRNAIESFPGQLI